MAATGSHPEGYGEKSARVASSALAGLYTVVWLVVTVGLLYLLFR